MLESKITEILGQLSDKLGVASAKIWEWSLLQVKVEAVTDVINIVFALLATTAYIFAINKLLKWWSKDDKLLGEDDFVVTASIVTTVIVTIILIVVDIRAFLNIWDLPQLLINPEYAAFENIVKQLGSLK